jgi:hypothetical protein
MNGPIKIDPNVITKNKSTTAEIFTLLYYYYNKEASTGIFPLIEKGFISQIYKNNLPVKDSYFLTDKGIDFIEHILLESEKDIIDKGIDFDSLHTKLKEIYPKGKKPGTNYYWVDNISTIKKKFKVFFKRYGKKYKEDDIIKATQKYINSFNGNYTYMQLLKYFIWKDKLDGSEESELLTYLENLDEEEDISISNPDWTTKLL